MSLITNSPGGGTAYMTTEDDAAPLIPEEVSKEIIKGINEESTALSLFRRLPNMSSRTLRMAVLDSLGSASFATSTVTDQFDGENTGDLFSGNKDPYETGVPARKATHQMEWDNVWITAEPLAIILPIGEDVLEDSAYPIWEEVRPKIIEAFNARIDSAIIWGNNRPTTWPIGIIPGCFNSGQTLVEESVPENVDVADDISDLMTILETQGYNPSGFISAISFKGQLRKLRDHNDNPIFLNSLQSGVPATLHGLPINFPMNNTFNPAVAKLLVGDMNQAVYSIRQDISFKVFTEGVIQDSNGGIIMNLMQNDMVALRVTMRLGWAIPNPIHAMRQRATSYPFAALLPPVVAGTP